VLIRDPRTVGHDLVADRRPVVFLLSREDEDVYKSFRNLPEVQCMLAGELNTYDVLNNDWVVFTKATLPGGES